jgi:hypothetical protein
VIPRTSHDPRTSFIFLEIISIKGSPDVNLSFNSIQKSRVLNNIAQKEPLLWCQNLHHVHDPSTVPESPPRPRHLLKPFLPRTRKCLSMSTGLRSSTFFTRNQAIEDFTSVPRQFITLSHIQLINIPIKTTMCTATNLNSCSAKLSGPATEALDQQASKKRRLSCPQVEENPASNALSEFDAMFNTVASSDCEAFPSIAWDFDDEDDSHAISLDHEKFQKSPLKETRMYGSGMLRSKSVKRDLSSLDVNSLNTSVSLASIDKISSAFNIGCKANCAPLFPRSATSGSLRSTLPHCGASLQTSRSLTFSMA